MKYFGKELNSSIPSIIGFDVEWTKNFTMKNANKAFCYSVVWVPDSARGDVNSFEETLQFGFRMHYVESDTTEECQSMCDKADEDMALFLDPQNMVVGHQFSSDISVLLACSEHRLHAVETLKDAWKVRKQEGSKKIGVFDTRYDLPDSKEVKSNRLVDVCPVWQLNVMQPEINGSMTKMQRNFYARKKQYQLIMEKIAVLNIRHSLSSVLLYLFSKYGKPLIPVNINTILYRNLGECFDYVRSPAFATLLSPSPASL
jgi:hypothetical protein